LYHHAPGFTRHDLVHLGICATSDGSQAFSLFGGEQQVVCPCMCPKILEQLAAASKGPTKLTWGDVLPDRKTTQTGPTKEKDTSKRKDRSPPPSPPPEKKAKTVASPTTTIPTTAIPTNTPRIAKNLLSFGDQLAGRDEGEDGLPETQFKKMSEVMADVHGKKKKKKEKRPGTGTSSNPNDS
jgi:hypothetical protein